MYYIAPTLLLGQKIKLLSIVTFTLLFAEAFKLLDIIVFVLFFTLSRRYCDWSVFFQSGLCNSLYQTITILSAFKDSILYQNLAALGRERKFSKILRPCQYRQLLFNMFVHTCMSVNIAGIQCQKMKSDM
jgi:hypothetical protein